MLERRQDLSGAVTHLLDGFALEPDDAVRRVAACQRLIELGAYEEYVAVSQRLVDTVSHDPRAGAAELARARLALSKRVDVFVGDIAERKRQASLAAQAAIDADDPALLAQAAMTLGRRRRGRRRRS